MYVFSIYLVLVRQSYCVCAMPLALFVQHVLAWQKVTMKARGASKSVCVWNISSLSEAIFKEQFCWFCETLGHFIPALPFFFVFHIVFNEVGACTYQALFAANTAHSV